MNIGRYFHKWFGFCRTISIIKTIYFNVKYLPLKDALRLPIFIYRHTSLLRADGQLTIIAPLSTGMIKIGHYIHGTQDERYTNTTWEVSGAVVFDGTACLGRGTNISVGKNAKLELGGDLTVSGDTEIYCHHLITIGNNCTLSWDVLVMDTDFHSISDKQTGEMLNSPQPIVIGSHVWVGCRVTILKGVQLANNIIVAAASLITKSFEEEYCVIGGNGKDASILKHGVQWEN